MKTPTHGCGCGFPHVWVQVALENPRVAHDNPYRSLYIYYKHPHHHSLTVNNYK